MARKKTIEEEANHAHSYQQVVEGIGQIMELLRTKVAPDDECLGATICLAAAAVLHGTRTEFLRNARVNWEQVQELKEAEASHHREHHMH